MKIVIDTNLLIDGATDDYNYGNRIIDAVIDGRVEAFANTATLRENKLLAGQKITDTAYLEKLNEFFAHVQHAPHVAERIHIVSDPEDNKLVESAVAVQADYLVSSDRHLLVLEEYQGVKMVSPVEFWNQFEDQTDDGWDKWMKSFIK